MSSFPPEWRAELMKAYRSNGADDATANEIIDLAVHAVDEAIKTMSAVTERGSTGPIRLSVLPLAVQLLRQRAEASYESMCDTMTAQGIPFAEVELQP
jgi:hypothetical protein